jgi:hypothetical protein
MVLVHPEAFYAGRDLVINGVTVTKGTELTPTQVGKFKHLDALVDRGWITVDPDPHQRNQQSPFGPHSSATMVKDRQPRIAPRTGAPSGAYVIPASDSEPSPEPEDIVVPVDEAEILSLPDPEPVAPVLPEPPESFPDWTDSLAVLAWVGDDRVRASHAEKEVRASAHPDNDLISQLDQIAYPPEGVAPPDAYDPGWTINEVKAWVGDDVDRALEAYTREQMRGAGMRSTLIEWLTPILAHVPQA